MPTVRSVYRPGAPGKVPANVSAYINRVFEGKITPDQRMPAGLHLYLPS